MVGKTYFYLGDYPQAIRQQERALEILTAYLGPDHPETLTAMNELALTYQAAGRLSDALAPPRGGAPGAEGHGSGLTTPRSSTRE